MKGLRYVYKRKRSFCITWAFFLPVMAQAESSTHFYSAEEKDAPFSSAVQVDTTLYLSGVIGINEKGHLPDGFGDQARNVMNNIAEVLHKSGADFSDVFKCSVTVTDVKNIPEFNRIYLSHFSQGHYPVRMVYGVSALALGTSVEVQCDAHHNVKK